MIRPDVREAVTGLVAQLAEVFGTRLSEARVELYVRALGDLAPSTLSRAAQTALERCKRFPMPAELRELAFERRAPMPTMVPWLEEVRPPTHPKAILFLQVVQAFLGGRLSRAEYLRALREFGDDCPEWRDTEHGMGTMHAVADALERRWQTRGLLDDEMVYEPTF